MLELPHAAALASHVERLRAEFGEVPWFDPADGGAAARLLLLLETPGPRVRSTGFVSLDNPDGTARNLQGFVTAAGIERRAVLVWNVVPWIIHGEGDRNRAPTRAERERGLQLLPGLLEQLPELRAVVLLGRHAAAARAVIAERRPALTVVEAAHPSPTYVCTNPAIGPGIVAALRWAGEAAGGV